MQEEVYTLSGVTVTGLDSGVIGNTSGGEVGGYGGKLASEETAKEFNSVSFKVCF